MKVKDIADIVETIVPKALAQDWDNVGLLVGDNQKRVKNILLTIDVTAGVVSEAQKLKTDLIISYHPVILLLSRQWTVVRSRVKALSGTSHLRRILWSS